MDLSIMRSKDLKDLLRIFISPEFVGLVAFLTITFVGVSAVSNGREKLTAEQHRYAEGVRQELLARPLKEAVVVFKDGRYGFVARQKRDGKDFVLTFAKPKRTSLPISIAKDFDLLEIDKVIRVGEMGYQGALYEAMHEQK